MGGLPFACRWQVELAWASANPGAAFAREVTLRRSGCERGSQRSIGAAQGCAAGERGLPVEEPNTGEKTGELTDHELDQVTGADKAASGTKDTPKEQITFTYGSLNVRYVQQDQN